MKNLFKTDNWKIVQDSFDVDLHEAAESIFSIGNGSMGQRANFEEAYSGSSLQGTYVAGIYYPDKTRVGWWKNGYPEYFAKVLNAPDFTGIGVVVGDETLDLNVWNVVEFRRELDMQSGLLLRMFTAISPKGRKVHVKATRFLSMTQPELAAIRYSITMNDGGAEIRLTPSIDGNVKNKDANYDEHFWNIPEARNNKQGNYLLAQTRKLDFRVAMSMQSKINLGPGDHKMSVTYHSNDTRIETAYSFYLDRGQTVILDKMVAVTSSLNHSPDELAQMAQSKAVSGVSEGFDALLAAHTACWAKKWHDADIVIEGDVAAQQGIRFNIFQLTQTYTGDDARLNIGPKGFTGEKYGGSTYWDTEAYCVPFFLGTASTNVTRNLLLYRYKHLDKAIENAQKLGFDKGAALYPMVTMNGEECHNEWEITFEEIHRNGAIAYAIYNYVEYTGDRDYLADFGLEVLLSISRFWAQRFNWSGERKKYVMLGVTGPNEYENNVNNNWYTNYLAVWCMNYTREVIREVEEKNPEKLTSLFVKRKFNAETETALWKEIASNVELPHNKELGIFLQQDGYLDKEQMLASQLPANQRPINQHWSWDRILRSCFIKQADVLQGIFLFENHFDFQTIQRNFDFYEPRCVHESSLSPCVHSIIAAYLGKVDKAYELYLRTSRLDLDDYNREVHEGLHITSMAGTWMSLVMGFGGVRVRNGQLHLSPVLPDGWDSFSFKIVYRNRVINVTVNKQGVSLSLTDGDQMELILNGNVTVIN
jgi:maltose phosphorylase